MRVMSRVLWIAITIAMLGAACNTSVVHWGAGDGLNTNPSAPSAPDSTTQAVQPSRSGVRAIAAGDDGSLAVMTDGTVWAWGMNVAGLLGNNREDLLTPRRIEGLTGVVTVATSGGHSLALTTDGSVWAWGTNDYGELGDAPGGDSAVPVKLNLPKAVAIDASSNEGPEAFSRNSIALARDGTVWVWGSNVFGQLGPARAVDTPAGTPVQVPGLQDVGSVACGRLFYTLAVRQDGTVQAWGRNTWIRLGTGSTEKIVAEPTRVQGLDGVAGVAGAEDAILALKRDGTVWVWGDTDQPPSQVPGLSNVTAIAASQQRFLVLRKDGTVWAWGDYSDETTLGTGQSDPATFGVPHPVAGLTDVVAIAAGAYHSLALTKDGTVWAWGRNNRGQLGDGTKERRATPVQVRFPGAEWAR